MPEHTTPDPRAGGRRRGAERTGVGDPQARFVWLSIAPTAVTAVLGTAATIVAAADLSAATTYAVLAVLFVAFVAIVAIAVTRANSAARLAHRPLQSSPESDHAGDASARDGSDQEMIVMLARRLLSPIYRSINTLDDLERKVEDPVLLEGLFGLDHQVTFLRRIAEDMSVLGGAMPRRQSTKPVDIYKVLRESVAETQHYHRVQVFPPDDATVQGHATLDLIHLLAELIENGTAFSPRDTGVDVHAENVPAGMAIHVQDRGLGIQEAGELQRYNALLANPDQADLAELVKKGTLGLYVVARLAQRHSLTVVLRKSFYGGLEAVVIIPKQVLGDDESNQQSPPAALKESTPSTSAASPTSTVQSRPAYARLSGELPVDGGAATAANTSSSHQPQAMSAAQPAPADGSSELPRRTPRTVPKPLQADAKEPEGEPAQDGRPPLPRRGTGHMAAELRDHPPTDATGQRMIPSAGLTGAFRAGVKSGKAEHANPQDHSDHSD
jgi:signal transduction histidine kinase